MRICQLDSSRPFFHETRTSARPIKGTWILAGSLASFVDTYLFRTSEQFTTMKSRTAEERVLDGGQSRSPVMSSGSCTRVRRSGRRDADCDYCETNREFQDTRVSFIRSSINEKNNRSEIREAKPLSAKRALKRVYDCTRFRDRTIVLSFVSLVRRSTNSSSRVHGQCRHEHRHLNDDQHYQDRNLLWSVRWNDFQELGTRRSHKTIPRIDAIRGNLLENLSTRRGKEGAPR